MYEVFSWNYFEFNFPDEQINKELLPWKEKVDAEGGIVVGSSLVTLDVSKCKYGECTFGNLVADAMVYSVSVPFCMSIFQLVQKLLELLFNK